MKIKWTPVAGKKEIGLSEDGNFSFTREQDWQYTAAYRALPNQPKLPVWIWLKDLTGRKLEFDTQDDALEEAQKVREDFSRQFS